MDEDTFEIVYGKFAEMDFESFEALTPDQQLEQFKKALKNQLKNTFKGLDQYKYDA
jgi:phosphohistidine phosphatase SixA